MLLKASKLEFTIKYRGSGFLSLDPDSNVLKWSDPDPTVLD